MKNITFKSISLTNFLSFGKTVTIPFTKGINIVTGVNLDKNSDGNGVGKSAIIDGFFFALFGETLKDLKKDEIVNHLAKKNAKVVLTFDINKNGVTTSYTIERGLAPSFCKVFINDTEDTTLSTIPVTNNYILNLISTSSSVFRNTITMSINSSIPFMSQKKNEKRDFIEGILRLELFKIMNKVSKENYDIIFRDYEAIIKKFEETEQNIESYKNHSITFETNRKDKIQSLSQRLNQYLTELATFRKALVIINNDDYTNILTQLEDHNIKTRNIDKKYNEINNAIIALESKQKINQGKINQFTDKLATLKLAYAKYPKYDGGAKTPEECIQLIADTRIKIDEEKTILIGLERDIKDLQGKIKTIKEVGSFCDKCKRPYAENDVKKNDEDILEAEKHIKEKSVEKQSYITSIQDHKTMIEKLELINSFLTIAKDKKVLTDENVSLEPILKNNYDIMTNIKKEQDDIKIEQKHIQTRKEELQILIERNKTTEKLISNHTASITSCENDIKSFQKEHNQFDTLIIESETKRLEYAQNIETYKEKIAIYDIIKYVVSDDGVKSFIIKKLLGVLNERIGYYLEKMDANCKLTFDEYFEDKIINDKRIECSYYNFSGGERKRIDLACMFAFMDLRRIQGDVTFNITFYDELLDSALSEKGSEKVFEILKERADKYDENAYIVTHKKENQKNNYITNVISLVKRGGITSSIIEKNGEE